MSTLAELLLIVQLCASGAMFGLIWFVQVVHYPLYTRVGEEAFAAYERAHTRLTGYVVGPLMLAETAVAAALLAVRTPGIGLTLKLAGLAVVLGIHASTALLQVPAHRRLSESYAYETAMRLVRTNVLRTAGWSLRLILAAVMAMAAFRAT
jgi:hypothetical protein